MHMNITLIVPYAHKWLIIWKERVPNNSLYCLHVAKLRSPVLQPNEQPSTMRSACDFLHIKYLKSSWSSLLCPIIWWRPQDSAASAWHSKICRSCATETPPEGVCPEKIEDWSCRSHPSISWLVWPTLSFHLLSPTDDMCCPSVFLEAVDASGTTFVLAFWSCQWPLSFRWPRCRYFCLWKYTSLFMSLPFSRLRCVQFINYFTRIFIWCLTCTFVSQTIVPLHLHCRLCCGI